MNLTQTFSHFNVYFSISLVLVIIIDIQISAALVSHGSPALYLPAEEALFLIPKEQTQTSLKKVNIKSVKPVSGTNPGPPLTFAFFLQFNTEHRRPFFCFCIFCFSSIQFSFIFIVSNYNTICLKALLGLGFDKK